MKLAILGGGGFRVPLVYQALLSQTQHPRIDRVSLYDVDSDRLGIIARVLAQRTRDRPGAPAVSTGTDLGEALQDADVVFCAMRVGGLTGRTTDERVALELGVLGQETTGAGGIAFALRTVPVALQVAEQVAAVCPTAWVINFTNPAGIVTEAMQTVLGDRVIGICDSPSALVDRAARALDLEPESCLPDYVGLNHLGWLRGLDHAGTDVLPDLLDDLTRLPRVEEARLFGPDWVRSLRAIPNEYLYYYYYTREAIAAASQAPRTRGEFLLQQQQQFYRDAAAHPDQALACWQRTSQERNETYMADVREVSHSGDRDQTDLDAGGYERVALAALGSLLRDERQTIILNVRNGATIPELDADAVIEVPCSVTAAGPVPVGITAVTGHQLGLIQQVKAVEQLAITAARTGSRAAARSAFALHPLVDSFAVAGQLLDSYCQASPEIAAALQH